MDESYEKINSLIFVSFNEDEDHHRHLHYVSVMKYRGSYDFANDMRDKYRDGWRVIVFTKDSSEIKGILDGHNLSYYTELENNTLPTFGIVIFEVDKEEILPAAFQNPEMRLMVLSDKEISSIKDEKRTVTTQKVFMDFLTSLKANDYVVHVHHGIGRFLGLEKRTVDAITREYLKIGYAENDKLFVPIDQADKVNKYIGADEAPPRLTRLGSAEWDTITKKVQKETEAIAKELLLLYAERKAARGVAFKPDTDVQALFEKAFEYEETPGQLKAIIDTKLDMEHEMPMDRLICGDVGFGKTEIAMRAAFKAVQNKMQVAFISPITILADQHYRSLLKRMDGFDVRVELLSRFRTASQQKEIVKRVAKGEVDIVIGTHRLLQKDIAFKNLGLVIIDEEQRFGVKQKEALKQMKKEVDVLTLTATPIPRTLNIALNKLRDISTITTPPPGRLPIITEVRRYSMGLIREAILREISRGGQIYFLHNRVQTIEAMAAKLRSLVPEAKFEVAHGKLGSGDLEERILGFKDHKFDVLVSSTIIENGIDLSNANTLIVNNAERFGLSQLYQLRGRVGRGRTQAYAFFLYHGQRLKLDAKKRLRAIVEATELGSGFQIAMKDLEIRGAGDILGAKQHGVINVVGVSHFIRMLNKAVDDLKAGKVMRAEEPEEVAIELPVSAYIPDTYIIHSKDKINEYQKMSAADNLEYLNDIKAEMIEEYGRMPVEVINLFGVIELKILAKNAKLVSVKTENIGMNKGKEIVLHMSGLVKPENIMNLLVYSPKWYISGNRLRVNVKEMGMHWLDELRECIIKLAGSLREVEEARRKERANEGMSK
jgi:transcription-repair coupling factor (superfamily II helicase)